MPRLKDTHKTVEFELQIRRSVTARTFVFWMFLIQVQIAFNKFLEHFWLSILVIFSSNRVKSLIYCFVCCSKNANNSESEVVLYELEVVAMADVILQG